MKVSEQISNRFQELEKQATEIRLIFASRTGDKAVERPEAFHTWASSVMHLISSVFGENSPHYRNFSTAYTKFVGYASEFLVAKGIFLAAKSDYDGGYLFDLNKSISGEVFSDFVVAAKNALAENQKDVAAVLACAAFEDALKRYATLNGLNVGAK